ncbi:MAG: hypothetical protein LJE95_04295, partial [Acidobacteria bacterium]|nr:hypothetical protein [Acidobacteriota bacterium]
MRGWVLNGSRLWSLVVVALLSAPALAQSPHVQIRPWVVDHTANGAKAEFFVVLRNQADLSGAAALHT